ncbi:MAG TPA: hypothetical protein VFW87_01275 [Pirellulales bacterium]|nr:hypothetical protein [Pirellulales bacterium]
MDRSERAILDEFGEKLIHEVRDDAFAFLQRIISGKMRDSRSNSLFEAYRRLDSEAASTLHRFLAAAADSTFVRFLNFFDANRVPLYFASKSGDVNDVQQLSDGLVGELYSDSGWLAKFSRYGEFLQPIEAEDSNY